MKPDVTTMVAPYDVAPPHSLSPAEHHRRDDILAQIMAEPPLAAAAPPAPARRRRLPALILAGGAAAVLVAGGVAAVTVSRVSKNSQLLSSVELAAWTPTPAKLDMSSPTGRRALDYCRRHLTGDRTDDPSPAVTGADLRGKIASMYLTSGPDTTLCLVGSDGAGLSELVDPVPAGLPADALIIDTAGGHGNGDASFSYVGGFAGAAVKGVTLQGSGIAVRATVEGGRWTAWWPEPGDATLDDDASVTVTSATGRTRTLRYGAVPFFSR
ncbi:hypothetical protein AB0J83_35780 [Actinoplanes sp. NPDC049596]|uniref:hypothetical protein n=1 Tax=unclassified Actinoplanes TaxID=2626549 RepID=UPI0034378F12